MEGVGIVASVIAILQISTAILSSCQKYISDVEFRNKSVDSIRRTTESLIAVVQQIEATIQKEKPGSFRLIALQAILQKDGILMSCLEDLQDLKLKLEFGAKPRLNRLIAKLKLKDNFGRSLTWPFEQEDVARILTKIERYQSIMNLAMNLDQTHTLLTVDEGVSNLVEGAASNEVLRLREEIIIWFAAPNTSLNHNQARAVRQKPTCEWIKHTQEYKNWVNASDSFLWISGNPGSGKTVLCSMVIDHVMSLIQRRPEAACVYFYFDFSSSETRTTEKLLRSICAQLLAHADVIPDTIKALYSQSLRGVRSPGVPELKSCVQGLLNVLNETTLIIDAIDECDLTATSKGELLELMKEIKDWRLSSLRIAVTSRPELIIKRTIDTLHTSHIALQEEQLQDDIQTFIDYQLAQNPAFKKFPASVLTDIRKGLVSQSRGMFRWVVCQLDALASCPNQVSLSEALESLPQTLNQTYERIVYGIAPSHQLYAFNALQFIAFSVRPVNLEEVAEVVAIAAKDNTKFTPEEDRLFDIEEVLLYTSSLIAISTSSVQGAFNTCGSIVSRGISGKIQLRLAHSSVKEFLCSTRAPNIMCMTRESAHYAIARSCLIMMLHFDAPEPGFKAENFLEEQALENWSNDSTCLCFEDNGMETLSSYNEIELAQAPERPNLSDISRLKDFPFAKYAAQHWVDHYIFLEYAPSLSDKLLDLILCLLKAEESPYINWLRLYMPGGPSMIAKPISPGFIPSPLYCTSFLGLANLCKLLLQKGADVNEQSGRFGNPLQAAVISGSSATVECLLNNGADVNRQGGLYLTSVKAAIARSKRSILDALLEHGADIDNGEIDINEYLSINWAYPFASGGPVDRDPRPDSVLYYQKQYVAPPENATALQAAAFSGQLDIVQCLIRGGANIHARSIKHTKDMEWYHGDSGKRFYHSPIEIAASEGYNDIVEYLLQNGAHIEPRVGSEAVYPGPLHLACARGHLETVRLLLDRGANIDAADSNGHRPFEGATIARNDNVVRLLVERGATIYQAFARFHLGGPLYDEVDPSDKNMDLDLEVDYSPTPSKIDKTFYNPSRG